MSTISSRCWWPSSSSVRSTASKRASPVLRRRISICTWPCPRERLTIMRSTRTCPASWRDADAPHRAMLVAELDLPRFAGAALDLERSIERGGWPRSALTEGGDLGRLEPCVVARRTSAQVEHSDARAADGTVRRDHGEVAEEQAEEGDRQRLDVRSL